MTLVLVVSLWVAAPASAAVNATAVDVEAVAGVAFSGVVATFSAAPALYGATIDWGDGGGPQQASVTCPGCPNDPVHRVEGTHAYAQAGTFPVTVTITDQQQQQTVVLATATVRPAPSASFTFAPESPSTGGSIKFDGSGSAAPGASIVRYDWTFDSAGGTSASCTADATSSVAYADPGTYDVTLTITDSRGLTASATRTVSVSDAGATGVPSSAAGCGGAATGELAPGARPPPQITITAPATLTYFDRAPTTLPISGTVKAPSGIDAFCVTAPALDDVIPADCSQKSLLHKGRFENVLVVGLRPGSNYVSAWVRDSVGRVEQDVISVSVAGEAAGIDLRAVALEVTQGIQGALSALTPQKYSGVTLAEGGKTVVRLFADAPRTSSAGPFVRNVDAVLFGTRDGKNLPGSPLLADNGARDLRPGSAFSTVFDLPGERAKASGAYTFTLPASWTRGRVNLVGSVNPLALPPPVAECKACHDNNAAEVDDVAFTATRSFRIVSAKVIFPTSGLKIAPPASDAYDPGRAVTPIGDGQLVTPPYGTTIDAGDIVGDEHEGALLLMRLYEWAIWQDRYDPDPPDTYVGVHPNGLRGSTTGSPLAFFSHGVTGALPGFYFKKIAQGSYERGFNSLRHELGHVLGEVHASTGCGGNDNDQVGETWPDPPGIQEGRLLGIGLDRRSESSAGFYPVLAPGSAPAWNASATPREWLDLMSYCATDANAWTSTLNWERELATLSGPRAFRAAAAALRPAGVQAAAVRAASAPTLLVFGVATADGAARFAAVEPGPGGGTPSSASVFHLVARDAAGGVLADVPMTATPGHEDPSSGQDKGSVFTSLFTQLPATGVAALDIVRDGAVLAHTQRSAHAPTVRILSPRRGATVGDTRDVTLRWAAKDADGGALRARVEYSDDGAKRWRQVFMGSDRGTAKVPRSYLPFARAARLRVRISDGFNEGVATVGPLRSLGAPPAVSITSPGRHARISADATIYLSGTAFDDAGQALAAGRLR
ncbi:MAG: hypothetical protein QOG42_1063, partial [Solirubrobacteraceae bacterium]|nr:hypothetical protein [Solirubrobacteraceae bacterium]